MPKTEIYKGVVFMQSKIAELILENGMCFKGRAFGYVHDVVEKNYNLSEIGQIAVTDIK